MLLIISDCHGALPPWPEKRPGAILLLGDNAGIERLAVRRYPGVPAFGIPGNHDDADVYQGLPIQNLHGRAISFNGLRIGGLGGCLQYKSDPFLFTEREYAAILAQMPPVDVFISHCPPAGVPGTDPPEGGFWGKIKDRFRPREFYGAHEGSGALRQYILKKQPKLLFYGHLHREGGHLIGATQAIAVYESRLFSLKGGDIIAQSQ